MENCDLEHNKKEVRIMIDIDRTEVNRCLAKSIAYQQVGKTEEAEDWARKLMEHLQLAGILKSAK